MSAVALKAPRQSTVVKVDSSDGSNVSRNDVIVTLDSSAEQLLLSRLNSHAEKLAYHLMQVSDEAQATQRRMYLAQEATSYSRRYDLLSSVCRALDLKVRLAPGPSVEADMNDLAAADDQLVQAQYDFIIAGLKQTQYEVDLLHSRRYLSLIVELVKAEQSFAQRRVDQMTIRAPVDGRLRLFVGALTPVMRGLVMGQIE